MPSRFSIVERQEIVEKGKLCLRTVGGKAGLDYLLSCRKLSLETIDHYNLGFIPADVNHMLRGRIIIPIYDASNNLVSVSSRRISDQDDGLPVYWHERYDKSFYLFGVPQAKESMRRTRFCVVTEGQVDVMQMHNHGILNVVGLCSSHLSDIHLSIIYRYCPHIVLLLDRDENGSGQKAMESIIEHFKERGALVGQTNSTGRQNRLIPVYFPDELGPRSIDPDSFLLKYGTDKMREVIRQGILQ